MIATIICTAFLTAFIVYELANIMKIRKERKIVEKTQNLEYKCAHCSGNCAGCGCEVQKKIKEWDI